MQAMASAPFPAAQSVIKPMAPATISLDSPSPELLRVRLAGEWQITGQLPGIDEIAARLDRDARLARVACDVGEVARWDSSLVLFLLRVSGMCARRMKVFDHANLPEGIRRLYLMAAPAMERAAVPRAPANGNIFADIGARAGQAAEAVCSLCEFIGEITLACLRLLAGKSSFRRDEFVLLLQRCGIDALFLVSLISVLVGMIFAFVGVIQLAMFGAQIYIAHIVGIAMVRVMGAVMAGILMAGRTGASFAAELGIMQVNEEIDALRTLGIMPVDFLVIPRMLALMIMLPLLTLYADMMGILGGMVISSAMFDISPMEYWQHTLMAVKLSNLWIGLVNGFVFGAIVAIAGCYHGMKCERNAAGVGAATTSAVVSAITGIVIATALITFVCQIFGV